VTNVIVTTLNLAAIYGLVAVGISITWAGLGFLNLAQGTTFAVAGYGAWWASVHISSSSPVVILAGIVTGAACGVIICVAVFLPLYGKRNWEIRTLTATLALSFIGANVLLEVFGPDYKAIPEIFGSGHFSFAGAIVTADKTGTVISAVVVLTLAVLALVRTRIGLGVRALTQSKEGAALVGIDLRTTAFAILAASGALVGLASTLLAQTFYVVPDAGYVPLVKGLVVAMLGGLGSIRGTVAAALLVGGVEAVTATYIGQEYVLVTLFMLIVVVLLVRPRGLGGVLEAARA
jgi:branched-subunit amino acid ABC-type transport system permease component